MVFALGREHKPVALSDYASPLHKVRALCAHHGAASGYLATFSFSCWCFEFLFPDQNAQQKEPAPADLVLDEDGKFKVGVETLAGAGPRTLAHRFLDLFSKLDAKLQDNVASAMHPELDDAACARRSAYPLRVHWRAAQIVPG